MSALLEWLLSVAWAALLFDALSILALLVWTRRKRLVRWWRPRRR